MFITSIPTIIATAKTAASTLNYAKIGVEVAKSSAITVTILSGLHYVGRGVSHEANKTVDDFNLDRLRTFVGSHDGSQVSREDIEEMAKDVKSQRRFPVRQELRFLGRSLYGSTASCLGQWYFLATSPIWATGYAARYTTNAVTWAALKPFGKSNANVVRKTRKITRATNKVSYGVLKTANRPYNKLTNEILKKHEEANNIWTNTFPETFTFFDSSDPKHTSRFNPEAEGVFKEFHADPAAIKILDNAWEALKAESTYTEADLVKNPEKAAFSLRERIMTTKRSKYDACSDAVAMWYLMKGFDMTSSARFIGAYRDRTLTAV